MKGDAADTMLAKHPNEPDLTVPHSRVEGGKSQYNFGRIKVFMSIKNGNLTVRVVEDTCLYRSSWLRMLKLRLNVQRLSRWWMSLRMATLSYMRRNEKNDVGCFQSQKKYHAKWWHSRQTHQQKGLIKILNFYFINPIKLYKFIK